MEKDNQKTDEERLKSSGENIYIFYQIYLGTVLQL